MNAKAWLEQHEERNSMEGLFFQLVFKGRDAPFVNQIHNWRYVEMQGENYYVCFCNWNKTHILQNSGLCMPKDTGIYFNFHIPFLPIYSDIGVIQVFVSWYKLCGVRWSQSVLGAENNMQNCNTYLHNTYLHIFIAWKTSSLLYLFPSLKDIFIGMTSLCISTGMKCIRSSWQYIVWRVPTEKEGALFLMKETMVPFTLPF